MGRAAEAAAAILLLALGAAAARGDDAPVQEEGLWQRSTLTGDWGGARKALEEHGLTIGIVEVDETFGDSSGGVHRGTGYDGATALTLDADLDRLVGWEGATVNLFAAELRGHGLSQHDLLNILTISNIESQPETRLFNLYLEQSLLDGRLSIRAGQIFPSDEFFTSHYAAPFVNSSFSWPAIAGADLPGADPVTPLATPGARVRLSTGTGWSWQTGVFEGASNASNGPLETRASSGTGNGVLVFTELTLMVKPDESGTLPADYKIGAWYHSSTFADLSEDVAGGPLISPTAGQPRSHAGDFGGYAVIDRMLWNVPDTADQGLSVFARVAAAPDDRNLISFYADGGFNLKGMLPDRPRDVAGLAVAWGGFSAGAQALDRQFRPYYPDYPIRDHEAVIEATYQFALAPWWSLQPDLQYIIHPGGNSPYPTDAVPASAIRNALVIGIRSTLRF